MDLTSQFYTWVEEGSSKELGNVSTWSCVSVFGFGNSIMSLRNLDLKSRDQKPKTYGPTPLSLQAPDRLPV